MNDNKETNVEEIKQKIYQKKLEIENLKVKSNKLNIGFLITIATAAFIHFMGYALQSHYVVIAGLSLLLASAIPGSRRINADDKIEKKEKEIEKLEHEIDVAYGLVNDDLENSNRVTVR